MQARGRGRHQLQNASFPSLPWNSPKREASAQSSDASYHHIPRNTKQKAPAYLWNGGLGWRKEGRARSGKGKADLRGSYQKYLGGASVKVPDNEAWNGENWARNVGVHKGMFGLRDCLGWRRGLGPWPRFFLENCNARAVCQVWCGRGTFPLWGLPGKAL